MMLLRGRAPAKLPGVRASHASLADRVRLPYGVLGILQYLGPSLQFALGITVFGQQVNASYWAGLILVWIGSAVYLSGALRRSRHQRSPH